MEEEISYLPPELVQPPVEKLEESDVVYTPEYWESVLRSLNSDSQVGELADGVLKKIKQKEALDRNVDLEAYWSEIRPFIVDNIKHLRDRIKQPRDYEFLYRLNVDKYGFPVLETYPDKRRGKNKNKH